MIPRRHLPKQQSLLSLHLLSRHPRRHPQQRHRLLQIQMTLIPRSAALLTQSRTFVAAVELQIALSRLSSQATLIAWKRLRGSPSSSCSGASAESCASSSWEAMLRSPQITTSSRLRSLLRTRRSPRHRALRPQFLRPPQQVVQRMQHLPSASESLFLSHTAQGSGIYCHAPGDIIFA